MNREVNVPTPCAQCGGPVSFLAAVRNIAVPGKVFCSSTCMAAYTGQGPEPVDEEDEDLEPSMTFEEALQLVEEISQCAGWSAEICASGFADYEYITVQACFDRGIVYQVDLESREEWEYHRQRIDAWQKARKA